MQKKLKSEFELIQTLSNILDYTDNNSTRPIIGIGDDAAYLKPNLIVTTDAMAEGTHFRIGEMSFEDIGWKAIVSNQSDIAAMGGIPLYAVVSIGIPKFVSTEEVQAIYIGIRKALCQFGGVCVGGDSVASYNLFIAVTFIGSPAVNSQHKPVVLRRDKAQVGDMIAVTGCLGSAAAGLKAIEQGIPLHKADPLLVAHLHPVPKIHEAQTLAQLGVKCAMDISDGLVGDTEKLAIASKVSAVIYADKLPTLPQLSLVFPKEAQNMALTGGEDYQLLFTASTDTMDKVLSTMNSVTVVGEVKSYSQNGEVRVLLDGSELKLKTKGWENF